MLEDMLGGRKGEEDEIDAGSANHIAVGERPERHIRMMKKGGAPQVKRKTCQTEQRREPDLRRLPPIVVAAIDAYINEAQHEDAEQDGANPVDAEQGYIHGASHRPY